VSDQARKLRSIRDLGPGTAGVPACPRRALPWSAAQLFAK